MRHVPLVPTGRFSQSMAEMRTALALVEGIVEPKKGLTMYEVEVKQVPEPAVLLVRPPYDEIEEVEELRVAVSSRRLIRHAPGPDIERGEQAQGVVLGQAFADASSASDFRTAIV